MIVKFKWDLLEGLRNERFPYPPKRDSDSDRLEMRLITYAPCITKEKESRRVKKSRGGHYVVVYRVLIDRYFITVSENKYCLNFVWKIVIINPTCITLSLNFCLKHPYKTISPICTIQYQRLPCLQTIYSCLQRHIFVVAVLMTKHTKDDVILCNSSLMTLNNYRLKVEIVSRCII